MSFFQPLADLDPTVLLAIAAVMSFGGFVKGAVGFALPMITLSGAGLFLSAQETVGLLIIPTLVTNLWQTLRQGLGPAIATFSNFWRLNLVMAAAMAFSAQLLPGISGAALFVFLGAVVTSAAAVQLAGWRPPAPGTQRSRRWAEIFVGLFAGVLGGLSGVWGPPLLLFLIALGTEKRDQIRAQGMAFMIGSVVLVGAHLKSGVLSGVVLPLSVVMSAPILLSMALGIALQDRMDHVRFRRATLVVLVFAGLNLLRRGLS